MSFLIHLPPLTTTVVHIDSFPHRKENWVFKMGSKPLGKRTPCPDNSPSVIYQKDQTLRGLMDLLSKEQGDCLERHIWGLAQEHRPGRWTSQLDPWAVLDNRPCSEKTPTFHRAILVGNTLPFLTLENLSHRHT